MIKGDIEHIVKNILINQIDKFDDSAIFYVNCKISTDNRISVFIDSMNYVAINDCVKLSKLIEEQLDREKEDFELLVSSAGMDQPFMVRKQYNKNKGKQIKLKISDGKELKGILMEINDSSIVLKQKDKKSKKKNESFIETEIKFEEIKEAKLVITF